MVKAASPIRLQKALMESARVSGSVLHRSAAEQIEYWADLGRKISNVIDPEVLLAVQAGLARITVEEVEATAVDPDSVFSSLENNRETGVLAAAIAERSPIRYQASASHSGLLEQVNSAGESIVGTFVNGEFQPSEIE